MPIDANDETEKGFTHRAGVFGEGVRVRLVRVSGREVISLDDLQVGEVPVSGSLVDNRLGCCLTNLGGPARHHTPKSKAILAISEHCHQDSASV